MKNKLLVCSIVSGLVSLVPLVGLFTTQVEEQLVTRTIAILFFLGASAILASMSLNDESIYSRISETAREVDVLKRSEVHRYEEFKVLQKKVQELSETVAKSTFFSR